MRYTNPHARADAASDASDDDDDEDDEDDDDDGSDSPAAGRAKAKPAAKPKSKAAASAGVKRQQPAAVAAPAAKKKPAAAAAAAADAASGGEDDGDDGDGGGNGALSYGQHEHWSWKWLQPPLMRDAAGRAPAHPEFNRRTLRVPAEAEKHFSPAKKQWWAFKAAHYDTLLFFRQVRAGRRALCLCLVPSAPRAAPLAWTRAHAALMSLLSSQGKFYETFNMDADALVAEGIAVYMKGKEAHAGLPERSYGAASEKLRARGYRIARIEQTETPEAMRARTGVRCMCGSMRCEGVSSSRVRRPPTQ